MNRRNVLRAAIAALTAVILPARPNRSLSRLEIPRDLCKEENGDVGRGTLISSIEDYDTTGYEPFVVDGRTRFPLYGSNGLPTGTMWMSFIPVAREDRRVNIEVRATVEERRRMLDMPARGASGATVGGTFRDQLIGSGVHPESWVLLT